MPPKTTQNPKLDRALSFLKEANKDFATTSDVAKVLQAIIDYFTKREKVLSDKIDAQAASNESAARSSKEISQSILTHRAELDRAIAQSGKSASDSLKASITLLIQRLSMVENATADHSYTDNALAELENGIKALISDPETPESIRNKLESLTGASRLSMDAIFGLEEALDDIKKRIEVRASSSSTQTVIAYTRGAVKFYDLSDKLDGVKKTFALPAFWRVISVQSTSSPTVFRPGVDYNENASDMTITFTDGIDAGSTLSAGQTLLVLYVEP